MTKKIGLCFAVAAVLSLAMATDSQAFWGSRGGWGSGGSSGGSGGSWGSSGGSGGSGGSWGSNGGSHGGGLLGRIFNRGSHGSCGSSGGYSGSAGSHGSNGSAGGHAYYGGGATYASSQRQTTYAVASQAPAVKTQLTLRVPADAKVTLAGVATKRSGEVRQFSTSRLTEGQAWQNYQVVVEMDRNGKTLREERTITLVGGKAQELSIGVGDTTLARLAP